MKTFQLLLLAFISSLALLYIGSPSKIQERPSRKKVSVGIIARVRRDSLFDFDNKNPVKDLQENTSEIPENFAAQTNTPSPVITPSKIENPTSMLENKDRKPLNIEMPGIGKVSSSSAEVSIVIIISITAVLILQNVLTFFCMICKRSQRVRREHMEMDALVEEIDHLHLN